MVTTRESRHATSANISPLDPRLQDSQQVDADHEVLRAALNNYDQSDNQLAGLVEAATAAAGQESAWTQGHGYGSVHQPMGSYASHLHGIPTDIPDLSGNGSGHDYPVEGLQETGTKRTTRKRKRGEASPTEQQVHFDGDLNVRDFPPQQVLVEARAAGVRSAAALFREPSSNSKKSTRLAMSELFGSLEQTAENYIHLSAAAKNYMLDEDHPERRDGVGMRGKGDGDMAKLTLWRCAETFLEQDDIGQRYFTDPMISEEFGPRTMFWPADKQKIIKVMVPLCRRMVTNERQREYAVTTRKGGGPKPKKSTAKKSTRKSTDTEDSFQPSHQISQDMSLQSSLPKEMDDLNRVYNEPHNSLKLLIIIMRASHRYVPPFFLCSYAAPNLNSLRVKVDEHLVNNGKAVVEGHMSVKVHLTDGLVPVDSDGEWTISLMSAGEMEWMAGEVKVVIDINDGVNGGGP